MRFFLLIGYSILSGDHERRRLDYDEEKRAKETEAQAEVWDVFVCGIHLPPVVEQ